MNNLGGEIDPLRFNDKLQYLDYRLRNKQHNLSLILVEPDIAYRYQGNFYGLMLHFNVLPELFPYTLYANGYTSPHEYDGKRQDLYIPRDFPTPFK